MDSIFYRSPAPSGQEGAVCNAEKIVCITVLL